MHGPERFRPLLAWTADAGTARRGLSWRARSAGLLAIAATTAACLEAIPAPGWAQGRADGELAPAVFADAVLSRLNLMLDNPNNLDASGATFPELQQDVAGVATSYKDVSVDPGTGNAWELATLLQQASGTSSWLPVSASTKAREAQITAVLGAMGWRRAAYVAAASLTSEVRARAAPGSTCNIAPSTGLTQPSPAQVQQWQSQYQQALHGSWLVTSGGGGVGVSATGGSGYSSVTAYRALVNTVLPHRPFRSHRQGTATLPFRAWRSTWHATLSRSSPSAQGVPFRA